MNEEVVKALKNIQEQMNNVNKAIEDFLLEKHEENSAAIDNIVITMLGGSNESETK